METIDFITLLKKNYPEYAHESGIEISKMTAIDMPNYITLKVIKNELHITMFNTGDIPSKNIKKVFYENVKKSTK